MCNFLVSVVSRYAQTSPVRRIWGEETKRIPQISRADSRFAPSQWKTVLLCKDVSQWLGASLESALIGNSLYHHTFGEKSTCFNNFGIGAATGLVVMLTHWGRDKMDAISQTTLSNTFSWIKMFEFRLKFHWSLFPRVQLRIFQHWFR